MLVKNRVTNEVIGEFDISPGANLSEADLSFADLSEADLSFANLSFANLSYANLSHANLRDVNLYGANLPCVNLRDVNLFRADLAYANLFCTDLTYTKLFYTGFHGANLENTTINWNSHDLIAEILKREADGDVKKLKVAGLVLLMREWCWKDFIKIKDKRKKWVIETLKKYVKDDDNAPSILK